MLRPWLFPKEHGKVRHYASKSVGGAIEVRGAGSGVYPGDYRGGLPDG